MDIVYASKWDMSTMKITNYSIRVIFELIILRIDTLCNGGSWLDKILIFQNCE